LPRHEYVSGDAALSGCVLAGIALDGDRDAGVRLDVPHDVDEIARIFGLQLQADLAS
jgi:hypothetical protein